MQKPITWQEVSSDSDFWRSDHKFTFRQPSFFRLMAQIDYEANHSAAVGRGRLNIVARLRRILRDKNAGEVVKDEAGREIQTPMENYFTGIGQEEGNNGNVSREHER